MEIKFVVIIAVAFALAGAIIGILIGNILAKNKAQKDKNSAVHQASQILSNALSEAEATKKAQLIEAKDEIHKLRTNADKEIRERRNEVQRQENS